MPGPLPHALLLAVCESFPFASAAAHSSGMLELGRSSHDLLDRSTQPLAVALEQWLRPRARGLSLEAIRLTRDRAWFEGGTHNQPLADYLVLVARRYLEVRGPRVALRVSPSPGEPVEHHRWRSLLLPTDLLVAAIAADTGVEPSSDHIDICTPKLARLLDDVAPVAETHLHVGAAVSFELLWTALASSLGHYPPDAKTLESGGDPPFGSGRAFLRMLHAAAITRLLLASFLWSIEHWGGMHDFCSFIEDERGGLHAIAERASWPWGSVAFGRACRSALRTAVTANAPPPSAAHLGSVLRHLLGDAGRVRAASVMDLRRGDPLADWIPVAEGATSPENRFTVRGLRYLRGAGRRDRGFALAFWQYQRIRALTYRHVTVEPGTAGLDWFQQHYQRISPLRAAADAVRFEAAIRLEARGANLRAIEVRTSPEPAWYRIRDLTRQLIVGAAAARDALREAPEIGLVLHFLKERERTGRYGQRQAHADPRQIVHGCRFGAYAYKRLKEALAIEAALEHMPELLLVLRGLDAASSELAVPTWVLVPSLARVRRASERAAAKLHRRRPVWRVERFGLTFHAGEDFRRLPEGLRRIHELLETELISAGDRIGHGLAAGIDPERWARACPVTMQPAEERLDDLLWEIDRCERGDLPVDASRIERVRRQARDLVLRLFGRTEDIDLLAKARRLRHDPRTLDRMGYPFPRGIVPANPIERLVHEHLTDPGLFLRGQQPEAVRVSDDEVLMLNAASRWLRRELAAREVTVEVNPSSNCASSPWPVIHGPSRVGVGHRRYGGGRPRVREAAAENFP